MGACLSHFFFFKQKTAYGMRISDWSSDVCSSDLGVAAGIGEADHLGPRGLRLQQERGEVAGAERMPHGAQHLATGRLDHRAGIRSEERRVGTECGSTGRSRG